MDTKALEEKALRISAENDMAKREALIDELTAEEAKHLLKIFYRTAKGDNAVVL